MSWSAVISHATGDPVISSDWNAYVAANAAALFGDGQVNAVSFTPSSAVWASTSLTGSWSGTGYYRRTVGELWLKGTATGGTPGATAFTLPSSYRPAATVYVAAALATGGGATSVEIDTGGDVIPQGSSASFEGIRVALI
jgi:hypothetical protein